MIDPRVKLKNPIIAAILAYLVPGLGHLYQGRNVKAAIYFVCIMGVFTWGCSLGEAKAVHLRWDSAQGQPKTRTAGFIAQAGIGMVAIPAYVQFNRYVSQFEKENSNQTSGAMLETIDSDFTGMFHHKGTGEHGSVTGRVTGQLVVGQYGYGNEFSGSFVGKTTEGRDVKLTLSGSNNAGSLKLGPKVTGLDDVTPTELVLKRQSPKYSGSERRFYARIVDEESRIQDLGVVEGTIPRATTNHMLAPLSDESMQHLHGRLGKYYELALVYTWIAGLLNVLAIWDALQGPAYGYGDEKHDEPEADKKDAAAPASTVTA